MDCPSCGETIDKTDWFCKFCGSKIRAEKESTAPSRAVEDLALEYRNVLNDTPDDPDSLYNVGLAELYSGKPGVAEEYFRRLIEVLPDDFAAHEKLAVCLSKLGRGDEALESARAAHRLDPERISIQRMIRTLGG